MKGEIMNTERGFNKVRRQIPQMKFLPIALILWWVGPTHAVIGDLDLDGDVDLEDFFIFADHFGQTGPPDTLRVVEVVYDTLLIETVYDTVSVEFVEPPADIKTVKPDSIVGGWISGSFEPLAAIRAILVSDAIYVDALYREPIDESDDPTLDIYSNRVVAYYTLKYVPLSVNDNLEIIASDTTAILRDIRLSAESGFRHFIIGPPLEDLRFENLSGTAGDLIADLIWRTEYQGDFATRLIFNGSFDTLGKIDF